MFKCYLTGIELNEESAYVLDIAKAKRIIRALKNQSDALNKLIDELGSIDKVEIVGKKGRRINQRRHRFVCKQLAEAYGEIYMPAGQASSEKNIFVPWKELQLRMKKNKNLLSTKKISQNIFAHLENNSAN